MFEKSESIKNLAGALKEAQDEIRAVKFDSTNLFLKNKYASLGAIIEAAKPALSKHGLVVSQPVVSNADGIGVTTILLHTTGEWISSTASLRIEEMKGKSVAQEAGSIVTYLRRYSLAAILNIYSDEDTDGQKTEQKPSASNPKMTLAKAEAMTGGTDHKPYRDCTDEELEGKKIGLEKLLAKSGEPSSNRMAWQEKLDAVNLILKARNGG